MEILGKKGLPASLIVFFVACKGGRVFNFVLCEIHSGENFSRGLILNTRAGHDELG
jgi:hypothetical protein